MTRMKNAEQRARASLATRLGLPAGFFTFDVKDTLRLIIWIVVASFTLGGLWAQRKSDLDTINGRQERTEKVARELASQVETNVKTINAASLNTAAILTGLDGIRTEIRYVNEKIDVLRQDVRDTRAGGSAAAATVRR